MRADPGQQDSQGASSRPSWCPDAIDESLVKVHEAFVLL